MKLVKTRPPGVLIVDDDASVRSFLRAALRDTARVVEAEDGEQAIEILEQHTRGALDLALVDYVLPRRSGLDVLRVTRRSWPWIPVVILTGFGSEDVAVQALRARASDYLTKPIGIDVLRESVRVLTATRAATVPSDDAPDMHPGIRRALAFMREHFTEDITLADVARGAALSRFYFCRLFHREAGVPFHEYLNELRVARAQVLLADHHVTVTEVAYAVGFNDLSHFDRTFRRMVGLSPTEYRTSLRCA